VEGTGGDGGGGRCCDPGDCLSMSPKLGCGGVSQSPLVSALAEAWFSWSAPVDIGPYRKHLVSMHGGGGQPRALRLWGQGVAPAFAIGHSGSTPRPDM